MASSIQRRRGTTSDHATFTGAVGEITIDTTKDTVVVHDGAGVGGVPLLREDLGNLPAGAVGDAKLATIATAGKVSNSATTATSALGINTIVARDGSNNFTAGTVTAALTGAASSNVLKAGDTMTGALVVPLGAFGTPSLTFTGDLNTGIYSPGADQLAVATNGTGRLFVDASGNLGVGASPVVAFAGQTHLTVNHSTGGTTVAGINLATDGTRRASLITYPSNSEALRITADSATLPITFHTNSSERLRITSSGNVGIGTTSPGYPLHISSATDASLYIEEPGNNTVRLKAGTSASFIGTTSNHPFYFTTNNTERLRITASGLVGIGTSAPDSILHCVGSTVSEGDAAGQLVIRSNSAYNATPKSGIIFQILQDSSNSTAYVASIHAVKETTGDADRRTSLVFGTRAISGTTAERMRITSGSLVGIGTTSPTTALDVRASTEAAIRWGTTSNFYGTLFADATLTALNSYNSNPLAFSVSTGTGFSEKARIDTSGRLLVGTSSARSNFAGNTSTPLIQTEGTSAGASSASIVNNSNGSVGSTFNLGKSRASSVGGNTVVASGDEIGIINFQAADGTNLLAAASIQSQVDGTPGANDMPGRLIFNTTLDGASSPTERLRITNAGLVGIGTSAPGNLLHVESSFTGTLAKIKNNAGNTSADTALEIESSTTAAKTFLVKNAGTERFYVKGDGTSYFNGSVGIGTTPNAIFEVAGSEMVIGTNHHVTQYLTSTKAYNATPGGGLALYYKYNSADAYTYGAGVSFEKDNTNDGDYGSHLTLQTRANGGNATERLRITSAGLVGIGTSSPASALYVSTAPDTVGATNGASFNTNNPGLTVAQINSTTTGMGLNGILGNFGGDTHLRSFWGFSIDKGGGNLSSGATNTVNTDSRTFAIRQFAGGTTWNTQFCVKDSGNVGIGTTSPNGTLDINNGAAVFSNSGTYIGGIGRANGLIGGTTSELAITTSAAQGLLFGINNAEKARIDNSGRLLVGTTSSFNGGLLCIGSGQGSNPPSGEHIKLAPSVNRIEFLDSSSNASDTGSISLYNTVYNNRSANIKLYHPAGNTGGIAFETHDGTSLTERMNITSAGFVGIGTSSPADKLHISLGAATGNYVSYGETQRDNNGLNKIAIFRHGYWSGIREVASIGVVTTTSPAGAGFGFGNLVFYTGSSGDGDGGSTSTERLRITSGGLVGIGTTSPSAPLHVKSTNPQVIVDTPDASTESRVRWYKNGSNVGAIASDSGNLKISSESALSFVVNGGTGGISEHARIDSSGRLLVGTSSAGAMLTVKSNSMPLSQIATTSVTGDTIYQAILVTKFDNDTTTSQNFIQFQVNNGNANCGRITANGANTAAFGSTSDIRLKEHVENLLPQLENILNLRPVEFDYIESEGGGHQIGFIAQEMQAIYPDVVSERGEDDMLMITGWSKTEARLVKALQEAVAKIETLETRLSALEAA